MYERSKEKSTSMHQISAAETAKGKGDAVHPLAVQES